VLRQTTGQLPTPCYITRDWLLSPVDGVGPGLIPPRHLMSGPDVGVACTRWKDVDVCARDTAFQSSCPSFNGTL